MIHIGKNTTSKIISKGISAGFSDQTYRGLVKVAPTAANARNYSQCDSLLLGSTCGSHTVPYIAGSLIVNGFCKEVMQQLPMEFAIEAAKLINISLGGSVG